MKIRAKEKREEENAKVGIYYPEFSAALYLLNNNVICFYAYSVDQAHKDLSLLCSFVLCHNIK